MAIVEGIAAAKAAFEVSKVVLDLTRFPKLDIQTIHTRLIELQGLLLTARSALGDAEDEIRSLKATLDDRNRLRELQEDLEFVQTAGFWISKSDREKGFFIPYCPVCWGDAHKLIPLVAMQTPGYYGCSIHKNTYKTEVARKRESLGY